MWVCVYVCMYKCEHQVSVYINMATVCVVSGLHHVPTKVACQSSWPGPMWQDAPILVVALSC